MQSYESSEPTIHDNYEDMTSGVLENTFFLDKAWMRFGFWQMTMDCKAFDKQSASLGCFFTNTDMRVLESHPYLTNWTVHLESICRDEQSQNSRVYNIFEGLNWLWTRCVFFLRTKGLNSLSLLRGLVGQTFCHNKLET